MRGIREGKMMKMKRVLQINLKVHPEMKKTPPMKKKKNPPKKKKRPPQNPKTIKKINDYPIKL
jgi:hypothetical protein